MTKNKYELGTPLGVDPGLRERFDGINVSYRQSFKDVMCNHDQEQQTDSIDVHWYFEQSKESDRVYSFERIEMNSTGLGMTPDVVNNQFFHTLKQEDLDASKGEGVWSIGEKLFFAIMTKSNPELRERGVEILTKTEDMDNYYHLIYNPYEGENGVIEQEFLTYDEARGKLGDVPVAMGNRGTWTKMFIETKEWNTNWFDEVKTDVSNYFGEKIKRGRMSVKLELRDKQQVCLEAVQVQPVKIPCLTPDYADNWDTTPAQLDMYGKKYDVKHLIRPHISSDEMKKFDEMYPGQKAFEGLEEVKAGDDLVLIIEDKYSGYRYHIRKIVVNSKRVPRGVLKVLVTKDDLKTDISKNFAHLSKEGGEFTTKDMEHKKIWELWDILYPGGKTREVDVTNQLIDIMKGTKWPVGLQVPVYKELCQIFGAKPFDWDWAKKNITGTKNVLNKQLDIYVEETKHIVEVKIKKPDADLDFNQIVAYSTLLPECKKVTLLARSDSKGAIDLQDGFKTDDVSKFTTDLQNHSTTKHIEWDLVDLDYFGLGETKSEFIKPPK
jgi:hypothetical protein